MKKLRGLKSKLTFLNGQGEATTRNGKTKRIPKKNMIMTDQFMALDQINLELLAIRLYLSTFDN
jgi:hypothetical protein